MGILPLIFLPSLALSVAAAEKPKYGKTTKPLAFDAAYFKTTAKTDFWALIPHYVGQANEKASPVASATMVLNALLAGERAGPGDKNVDADELGKWNGAFRKKARPDGKGFVLEDFAQALTQALEAAAPGEYSVRVERFDGKDKKAELKRLEKLLAANERNPEDFAIVNGLQGVLLGNPSAAAGQFAPIGAYDAKKKRALVLDPDRKHYQPYWVPADKVFDAMNTSDPSSSKKRGLLVVSRGAPATE